jgi:cobalt-zinc-cadmium efflux system protein
LLKKGARENINVRAAYVHLLNDAVSSLAVIVGAVCIIVFNISWIDPALTIAITLYILKETYNIVREAIDVLLMSTPTDIDLNDVQQTLEAIAGVKNVHHVHVWKMTDSENHFEAHIDVEDLLVSRTGSIRAEIERCLHDRYDIHHTTLQFECDSCQTKALI